MESKMAIKKVHHVAYRCKEAKETIDFYYDYLGMDLVLAITEDKVPSIKKPDPYLHIFLDAGMGNFLTFVEIKKCSEMGEGENTQNWVQHIAFEIEDVDELLERKQKLLDSGYDVVGPTDHTLFQSIYFFDPNGHKIELAVDTTKPEMLEELKRVASEMTDECSKTKKAPKYADWLRNGEGFRGGRG